MSEPMKLDESTIRRLSVVAECDPRTIRKAAAGKPVRGMAGDRAREALRAVGYPVPAVRQ